MLPEQWDTFTKVLRAVVKDKVVAEMLIDLALVAAWKISDENRQRAGQRK